MKRLVYTAALVIATLIALMVLWYLRKAAILFLFALATAAALRPVAQRFADRGWPLIVALIVTYLATVALLGAVIVSVAGPLADDVDRFSGKITESYEQLDSGGTEKTPLRRLLSRLVPPPELIHSRMSNGPSAPTIRMWLGISAGVISMIVNAVLVLVLSLYWNTDHVRFERLWLSLLSVENRTPVRDIWRSVEQEAGAYLRSEIVQGLAAGIFLYLAAQITDQPYPALLAFIGAIAWLIPWIGGLVTMMFVFILWVPSYLLGETSSLWITAVPMAVLTLVVLSFLEFVVEPKFFDRRRYNSLLVVLVSVGLADVLGVAGFLLGPPLAAAVQICAERMLVPTVTPSSVKSSEQESSLWVRLARLRVTLAAMPDPPLHVISLMERLTDLMEKAGEVAVEVVASGSSPEREGDSPHPAK